MEEGAASKTNGISDSSRRKTLVEIVPNSREQDGNHSSEQLEVAAYPVNGSGRSKSDKHALETLTLSSRNGSLTRPAREVALNLGRVDPHLVSLQAPEVWAAEQFDALALKLIVATTKNSLKRVLVASTHQGEGRTSVLLNLAVALSRAGKRVLVVDSDLLRPSVLRLLGIETEIGLAEAVGRGLSLAEAILRILPCGVDVLPTRERVDNHVEILTSSAFWTGIDALDSHYDFILFDSPAMYKRPDTAMLIKLADTALIVIRPGKTRSSHVEKAIELLAGEDVLGVVLNRIPSRLADRSDATSD